MAVDPDPGNPVGSDFAVHVLAGASGQPRGRAHGDEQGWVDGRLLPWRGQLGLRRQFPGRARPKLLGVTPVYEPRIADTETADPAVIAKQDDVGPRHPGDLRGVARSDVVGWVNLHVVPLRCGVTNVHPG